MIIFIFNLSYETSLLKSQSILAYTEDEFEYFIAFV